MKRILQICMSVGLPISLFAQRTIELPPPHATKSYTKYSHVTGWKDGEKPLAPAGFTVSLYAQGLQNPRWLYELPNGDILVAESNSHFSFFKKVGAAIIGATKSNSVKNSANRITLLRDADHDGVPELRTVFLSGLHQPFGMVLIRDQLYVANTDAVWRFPYQEGATAITQPGVKIIDLPGGMRHWTRDILVDKEHGKLYVSVGSGTDHAEKGIDKEQLRAAILEMNLDGSKMQVYATGIRNPVSMGWAPGTHQLWAVVNERDELGNDLVPDYLTHVERGGFYGWPYSYFGQHLDPRVPGAPPGLVEKAIVPDFPLAAHSASLGMVFYTGHTFPEKYHNGVFITQHGSWNRKPVAGYKVVFIPFRDGKPAGDAEDFLTGFVKDSVRGEVRGRPVGILVSSRGDLFITDDKENRVWRVQPDK